MDKDFEECCKMQVLWSKCSYQEPNEEYQDGLGRRTQTIDHVVMVHILIWDKRKSQINKYSDNYDYEGCGMCLIPLKLENQLGLHKVWHTCPTPLKLENK